MGIDLTLLVFTGDYFSHTSLELDRQSELWPIIEQIEEVNGINVPVPFYSFHGTMSNGEHGYGDTQRTPYGDNLKYVLVKYLKPLKFHQYVNDNLTNVAVWAFLDKLPDDTKIGLYWD